MGVARPRTPDSPAVARVKIWIWIQSIVGTGLATGLAWALLYHRDGVLSWGLLGLAALWGAALLPLTKAAEALGPDRGRPSRNLPALVWAGWTLAQVLLLAHDFSSHFDSYFLNLGANLLLCLVAGSRAILSRRLKIPINRATLWGVLGVAGFCLALRLLPLGVMLYAWHGC